MFYWTFAIFSCSMMVLVKSQAHSLSKIHSKHVNEFVSRNELQQHQHSISGIALAARSKRTVADHAITECIYMTSDEGHFYHKASLVDGSACGIYIFAELDELIEVNFNYFDVPCENGGLVSFIDGWELNGEFFPSPSDHPKPIEERFGEFCGQRNLKHLFTSSQNVALIQYRMPSIGTGFSFTVRFIKNPTPCNTLLPNLEDIFTLRNYGKKGNCSISTLFPASVRVLALDIGISPSHGRSFQLETGTLYKCNKRGLSDYLQIGGSSGLDNTNLILADAVCGMNSKPAKNPELISCGTTTVRLVSTGTYDNSATVEIRRLTEDDAELYMSVFCP